MFASPPEQGQLVNVRQRQCIVSEVAKSTLADRPLQRFDEHGEHLVTQSSVEDDVPVKQAAAMLGVSPKTIRAWGAGGKIPEYRHPVNNYRLYKLADLEKFLRQLEKSVARLSPTERQSKSR